MKKLILFTALLVGVGYVAHAQTNIPSVTIGKQVWMKENLNVDNFRNGDPIPHAKTDEEWEKAGEEGNRIYEAYKKELQGEVGY